MSTEQIKQLLMNVNDKFKLVESDLYLDYEEDMFHIKGFNNQHTIYTIVGHNTKNPQLFSEQKGMASGLNFEDLQIIFSLIVVLASNAD